MKEEKNKNGKIRRGLAVWMILTAIALFAGGCTQEKKTDGEKRKIEFTVVRESEIPQDLLSDMEACKKEGFRTVFRDSSYLYLAVGYGEQKTGGYSVAVEELYTLDKRIHLKTKLIGPRKGERVNKANTYPYLVVKLELREETVEFD